MDRYRVALLITVGGMGQAGPGSRRRDGSVRDRHRQAATERIREGPSQVGHAVRRPTGTGGDRGGVHLRGAGGNVGDGRVQRARSMSVIAFFIPYLFMFAAMIRLQREPAGPDVFEFPVERRSDHVAAIGFRRRWSRSASRCSRPATSRTSRSPSPRSSASLCSCSCSEQGFTRWGRVESSARERPHARQSTSTSPPPSPSRPSALSTSRSNITERLSRLEYGPGR